MREWQSPIAANRSNTGDVANRETVNIGPPGWQVLGVASQRRCLPKAAIQPTNKKPDGQAGLPFSCVASRDQYLALTSFGAGAEKR